MLEHNTTHFEDLKPGETCETGDEPTLRFERPGSKNGPELKAEESGTSEIGDEPTLRFDKQALQALRPQLTPSPSSPVALPSPQPSHTTNPPETPQTLQNHPELSGEGTFPPTPLSTPHESLIQDIEEVLKSNEPEDFEEFEEDREVLGKSLQSTARLMQLSGMMKAIRREGKDGQVVEEYWPQGIKQAGALPVSNLYGREPFGRTMPHLAAVSADGQIAAAQPASQALQRSLFQRLRDALNTPIAKVTLGLVIGIGLLALIAKVVDIPSTVAILQQNLTTPRGIALALLSGVAFLLAFSIRGVRWKLFLNPVGEVSTVKAIQLFLVGIFLNFLLPIRGGEVAKSLMLKRIANIPISKSLPTVAMDKALDLVPALFIMAIVPLLGMRMNLQLWLVLGLVSGLLVCLIFFVILAEWKRTAAISLLQKMTSFLPKGLAAKIEGFATGFVDSLLAGASKPSIFIPAILLTIVAVALDGLFAMLAFWTVGVPISFGTAIFGYTVYNMFYILPTPPGQVGSNEAVGLLVFFGLLHLNERGVMAMFLFSHPWAAILMCISGMSCLSALGMKLSSAMKVQTEAQA